MPRVQKFNDDYIALSPRETEALKLVFLGKSNQEIATELKVRPRQISQLIGNACLKLRCQNKHDAAKLAKELGMLDP